MKFLSLIASFASLLIANPTVFGVDNPNIGRTPEAGLVEAADGNFYGTTSSGGTANLGTLFRVSSAGQLTTLADFTGISGAARGSAPLARLIVGSDGNLYGTTFSGGANDVGTVFRMSPKGGAPTVLVEFTGPKAAADLRRGANPVGGLVEDPAAPLTFYGTTSAGGIDGLGTLFQLSGGVVSTCVDFTGVNGSDPEASLIKARDGQFYGTTVSGGSSAAITRSGTVYQFNPGNSAIVAIHTFAGTDGAAPLAELVQGRGADNGFYGTSSAGGANNSGVVFRVDAAGSYSNLHSFDAPGTFNQRGRTPVAGLTFGADIRTSVLFGTTFRGGGVGDTFPDLGTLFQIQVAPAPATLTKLFTFDRTPNGAAPEGKLLLASDGRFYGTTSRGGAGDSGTVFRFVGATLTTLANFNAPPPPPPVITSSLSVSVTQGDAFQYQIAATNSPTTYGATPLPPGLTFDNTTGLISGTPTSQGSYTITISASNSGGTATASLQLTVNPPRPVITSSLEQNARVGEEFSYLIRATNSPTSFGATDLPPGLSIASNTGVISGRPEFPGDFQIQISATNAGGTGRAQLLLHVAPTAPPAITSPLQVTLKEGDSLDYQITATNVPTSYNAFTLPNGLSVNKSTGRITGVVKDSDGNTVAGEFKFTIQASNANGTDTETLTLSVIPPAPVITSPGTASGQTNEPFVYQITATNFPTSYGAQGLPPGIRLDQSSGIISGETDFAGTYQIVLRATNAGGTTTKNLTLTITANVPVITSADTATAQLNKSFGYQIVATNNPSSFGATGLPNGLQIDSKTGRISGAPTEAGEFSVFLSASNANGTGTKTLTLTVNPPAPVVTSATSVKGQQNVAFSYQITADNQPTSFGAIGLPDELSVNGSTGLISGTPTVSGTFNVQISASNGGGTGTANLSLTLTPAGTTLVQFRQADYSAISTDGSVTLNVDLIRAAGDNGSFSVNYGTSDGSATAGQDYQPQSGTVTFASGQTQQTITINLVPQDNPGADRNFTVALANPSRGVIGRSTTTVTISHPDLSTKLLNISTRGPVQSGENVMIAGFIIQGSATKQLVLRGIGPSLTASGVTSAINDPTIQLVDANGSELAFNDDFGSNSSQDRQTLSDNGLSPSDSREAAIVASVAPANYTVILRGKTNGNGLVEVYDISRTASSRFVNISTRTRVEDGDNGALIAGFISAAPTEQSGTTKRVVVRANGPSLKKSGISGALADTTLDIYRGSQLILSNDNWKTNSKADQQELIDTGLAPQDDKEAALVFDLAPGSYSAVVRGKNNTKGVALVEVYVLR